MADVDWGEELDPSEVVNPVVFYFRPNKYVKVGADRLRDWEELFAEKVGFRPAPRAGATAMPWAGSPGGCISGSNGDWDD